jgi:hypothetical protein
VFSVVAPFGGSLVTVLVSDAPVASHRPLVNPINSHLHYDMIMSFHMSNNYRLCARKASRCGMWLSHAEGKDR